MMFEHIVVYVTAPSAEVAQSLASTLVERRIVACVNIVPQLNSIYSWEGKICNDGELLLIMKTRMALLDKVLIPAVTEHHPYDVPEIIAMPIVGGSRPYLDWIDEMTTEKQSIINTTIINNQ